MNLAFPALIILLLILPGAIFRYSYARGSWWWSSPTSFRTFSDELAYSAVFAVGLHFLALWVVSCHGYAADFPTLLAFLSGNFGAQGQQYRPALQSVERHAADIGLYFLGLCLASGTLGTLSHVVVRWLRLDRRNPVLRFRNEWYYLLSGECTEFAEMGSRKSSESMFTFLSAIVDHGKECYLYWGLVVDWSFDGDGQLDLIRLRFAHRRLLASDRSASEEREPGSFVGPDDRYYEIRGDLFLLRYSEVKTLNLDYIEVDELPFGGTPPSGVSAAA